jgi:peptide/nickel transport system permease protein
VAIAALVGTVLGLIAGWRAAWLDSVLGRLADFQLAFPMLIFAIGIMTIVGSGFWVIVFALGFQLWVEFYRLVRGEVLAQRNLDYVDAARAIGRSSGGILLDEILPNIAHTVVVLATLRVGYVIIMEASLSFLGLGIQPPTPTWGSMIADGRNLMLSAWWLATIPGIAILGLVMGLNILGEGLRDALDPRRNVLSAH